MAVGQTVIACFIESRLMSKSHSENNRSPVSLIEAVPSIVLSFRTFSRDTVFAKKNIISNFSFTKTEKKTKKKSKKISDEFSRAKYSLYKMM